jgi:hypothetical protein
MQRPTLRSRPTRATRDLPQDTSHWACNWHACRRALSQEALVSTSSKALHEMLISGCSDKHGHPIFTLPIWPMGRTYVITSPEMVSALLRAPPTLTFDTILSGMTVRVNDSDPDTARIIQDSGENSLFKQYHKILTTQALTDGSDIQLGYLAELVNNITDGSKAELFDFVSRIIAVASNRTFFGPEKSIRETPKSSRPVLGVGE